MEASMLPNGKIETNIIFFEQFVRVISILLFSVAVVLIIYSIILSLRQKITKRNIANLHKKKQELLIEIQQITEGQKRNLADLAKLNAKKYLRQHKKIRNNVFFVESKKNVQYEKNLQFEKEAQFIEDVQIEEDVQFKKDVQFEKNVQFEEQVHFIEDVKFEEDVQFQEDVDTIKTKRLESKQGEEENEVKKLKTMMRQVKTEIKEKVIKKTVEVVKNVKSEENVQFGEDVQFEEDEQFTPYVEVETDVQFEEDVLFEDYLQVEEDVQFGVDIETMKTEELESTEGEEETEVKKLETMMRQVKVKVMGRMNIKISENASENELEQNQNVLAKPIAGFYLQLNHNNIKATVNPETVEETYVCSDVSCVVEETHTRIIMADDFVLL